MLLILVRAVDGGIRFDGACKLRMDSVELSRWGFAFEVDLKLDTGSGTNSVLREYLDEKFEISVNANDGKVRVEIDGVTSTSSACAEAQSEWESESRRVAIQTGSVHYFRHQWVRD